MERDKFKQVPIVSNLVMALPLFSAIKSGFLIANLS